MDSFDVEFVFVDRNDCGAFRQGLSAQQLEHPEFDIALPDSTFNMDSDTFSAIVTFVQHGGLNAVAGVAGLFKVALDRLPKAKPALNKVTIKATANDGGECEITVEMTTEEIRDLLNEKIFGRR